LTASEYERLAEFRHTLRQLERQTETEARNAGTTPQQYLLLLAVKGHAGDEAPNLTELAEVLQVVHNSVVQLVNRAEAQGLVTRREDPRRLDRRVVQIHLTPDGERLLARVSGALRTERQRIADLVRSVTQPD
jgi:DNA-binding MarR family transcriptional regulator